MADAAGQDQRVAIRILVTCILRVLANPWKISPFTGLKPPSLGYRDYRRMTDIDRTVLIPTLMQNLAQQGSVDTQRHRYQSGCAHTATGQHMTKLGKCEGHSQMRAHGKTRIVTNDPATIGTQPRRKIDRDHVWSIIITIRSMSQIARVEKIF